MVRPRGLGDVVLASAVLDALTRAYPGTPLDFVVERPSRGLLEPDSRIDGLFLLGGTTESARIAGGGLLDAVRWIRGRGSDLVVDLFSNPRTAVLAALSGAAYRVGLDKRVRRFAYNVRVPRFHGGPAVDRRWAGQVQLDFLRDAGISWEGEACPSVALTDDDRAFPATALRELGYAPEARFGMVLPGGSWESKRWSVSGFAAAAQEMARITGEPTLVLWGPPEHDEAREIARLAGDHARLAPPTTLRQMAATLRHADLFVVTDCLARHLAVVQQVPTVGVFGSTDAWGWTPPTGPHLTVQGGVREGFSSLREFPPEPVLEAIRAHFAQASLDTGRSEP